MECMICGKECKRRSKVFANGKKLFACRGCILKLRTHELIYCEACTKYHFNRKRPPEGPNIKSSRVAEWQRTFWNMDLYVLRDLIDKWIDGGGPQVLCPHCNRAINLLPDMPMAVCNDCSSVISAKTAIKQAIENSLAGLWSARPALGCLWNITKEYDCRTTWFSPKILIKILIVGNEFASLSAH